MSDKGLPPGFDIEEGEMHADYIRMENTKGSRRGLPMFSALPLRTEAEVRAKNQEIAPPPFPPIGTKTVGEVRRDLIRNTRA